MNRKLFFLLMIITVISGRPLFAQNNNPPVFSLAAEYTKLIPNSPEAEAMAKYGIIPVTLYTGMPNVAIPIYDIRWGSLTLPINLTYNNNGLKPAEEASRVGYGWCLNAGGVITRVVNGTVDESPNSRRFDSYPNLYDFNFDQAILDSIANGKTDGEPDVYLFNFNGITGKFSIINGKAYFSCQQDVEISMIGDNFQIITEDGTIYVFANQEITSSHQMDGGFIPYYTSAWFLSSVTSKDRKDIITFSYTSKPYQHSFITIDSYKEVHKDIGDVTRTFSTKLVSTSITSTQELVCINFGDKRVQFFQDTLKRLDIVDVNSDKSALKSICIYADNTTLIKKFIFNTGYFGNDNKLKLNELCQVDNNELLLNRYKFDYYSNGSSPEKNTRGIDYWGFYNGKDNNTSLISKTECGNDLGGDRSTDFTSAQNDVLSKITYPTGGTTSFEYEPNYYGNGTIQNVFAPHTTSTTTFFNNSNNGGTVTSSMDFNINVGQFVHFTYSRNIPDFPSYGVKTYHPIVKIMNGSIQLYSRIINYMDLEESDSLYLSIGNYSMILGCESTAVSTYATLSYKAQTPDVSLGTPGPGIRIKSIISDDKILNKPVVKNYTYKNDNGASSGYLTSYVGDGAITSNWQTNTTQGFDLTYTSGMHSGIGGMMDNQFYYTRVIETTSDGINTGKTTNEFTELFSSITSVVPTKVTNWKITLPNNFSKVNETAYNYDIYSTKNVIGVKSRLSGYLNGPQGFAESTDPLDSVAHTYLYLSNFSLMSYGYYRLKSESNTFYSDSLNHSTTSSKNYYYDNSKYSTPNNMSEINSKGETIVNKSIFPHNYYLLSPSIKMPDQIEDSYNSAISSATRNFTNGRSQAMDACLPSYGQYWTDAVFIAKVRANSAYKSAYFTAYRQATADRDNSLADYYISLNNSINDPTDPHSKAMQIMQRDHIINSPVEQQSYKKSNSDTLLTAGVKSTYAIMSGNIPFIEGIWATELTAPLDSTSSQGNLNTYYKKKIEFTYDSDLKLIQQKKVNDVPRSYLWGYSKQYPIAEAMNASCNDIAYTSFEGDETGNWLIPSIDRDVSSSITGIKSFQLNNNSISKTGLESSKQYIVSYWSNSGSYSVSGNTAILTGKTRTVNGTNWTYYEHSVSNTSVVSIFGTGKIDELRLYPKGAQMSSYTYTPLVGMTSQNDPKNNITYYNYDNFNRLANVTDGDKNILKEYTYNFGANPLNNLYYNFEMSQSFSKSGCGTGYYGSLVAYTVPLGRYSSSISQADANQLAQDDINTNGQNNANSLGTCISTDTHRVTIELDQLITLSDIGICTITIRDAGNNTVFLSRTSTIGAMFFKNAFIPSSSNGYYTVTVVPDSSIPITVNVNGVSLDLFSSHTWSQVSGDVSIIISAYIDNI